MLAEQKAGGYSTKYRFTGKEVDEETGLYYFGARYYDPRISLWYGVDPMAEEHPDYNPFVYTANNPINYIDPDGQDWYEEDGTHNVKWFEGSDCKDGWTHRGESFSYSAKGGGIVDLSSKDGKPEWSYRGSELPAVDVTAQKPVYGDYGGIQGQLNAEKSAGGAFSDFGEKAISNVAEFYATGALGGIALKGIGWLSIRGVTVVGEGMARVEAAASKIPGAKILNDMPKFTGTADQVSSQMMTYNRRWILQQMRSGRPILDIGRDLNRANPSIFYQMEQNMMKNYLKLHPNSFQIIKP